MKANLGAINLLPLNNIVQSLFCETDHCGAMQYKNVLINLPQCQLLFSLYYYYAIILRCL